MEPLTNVEMDQRNRQMTQYVDEVWAILSAQIVMPDIKHPLERKQWLRENGIGIHTLHQNVRSSKRDC